MSWTQNFTILQGIGALFTGQDLEVLDKARNGKESSQAVLNDGSWGEVQQIKVFETQTIHVCMYIYLHIYH